MTDPQTAPKGQQIQRLQKLQQALKLPEDQTYYDLLQEQIVEIKAAICAEKPLDQQIVGLEGAIQRKQAKRSKAVEEVNRLQQEIQDLDADIVVKESDLAKLKQKKLEELNLPTQQASPDLAAANQIQMLTQQVNQLQYALNLMSQQQAAQNSAGGVSSSTLGHQLPTVAQPTFATATVEAHSSNTSGLINEAAIAAAPTTPGTHMAPGTPMAPADGSAGSLPSSPVPLSSSEVTPIQEQPEGERALAIAAAQRTSTAMKPFVQRDRRERSPRRNSDPYQTTASMAIVDLEKEEDTVPH